MNVFHLVFVSIAQQNGSNLVCFHTFPIIASIWHLEFDVQFETVLDVLETLSILHSKINLYRMW